MRKALLLRFLLTNLAVGLGLLLAPARAGAQSFAPVVPYSVGGSNSYFLAMADLNHDERVDIVTSNYNGPSGSQVPGTVGVLLAQANGTFAPAAQYPTGGMQSEGLALGDVNGDGHADVVIANFYSNSVSVLLGTGTGSLGAPTAYSTGFNTQPFGVALSDTNRDGRLDIVVTNSYFSSGSGSGTVGVLLGTASGTFGAITPYALGAGSSPRAVVAADLHQDSWPDLLVTDAYSANVKVLLGQASGYSTVTTYSLGTGGASNSAFFVVPADVTGDGRVDLVLSRCYASSISVLPGLAGGGFGAAVSYPSGTACFGLAIGDVNGDGRPDAVVANFDTSTASVLLATSTGTFGAPTMFSTGLNSNPYALLLADVNGDSKLDIVSANFATASVGVLLNVTPLARRTSADGSQATLAPNPVLADGPAPQLAASSLPATARSLDATLLDLLGRPVGHTTVAVAQGAARTELPVAGLAAGHYLVRLVAHDASGTVVSTLPTQRLSVR